MPRFARMLADGMSERGHKVTTWAPQARLVRLPLPGALRKWMGYIDQYLIFPAEVRKQLKQYPADTLFVFTDQALGPWVPLVAGRPHVIHCHDFLAQRSALGEIAQNPTSWTGRQYQAFIRQGYRKGRHFISVSHTTRTDLHRFLPAPAARSEVVYNGFNQKIVSLDAGEARVALGQHAGLELKTGYLLHVGGNQWYKNREGVIELYDAWRASGGEALPLLLVGEAPHKELETLRDQSAFKSDIYFLVGLSDELVRTAYAGATVFLFPSLAEGFGWPIAEAMAAGSPVITTQEAPMTEVGGEAAYYIPLRPPTPKATEWAKAAAQVVQQVGLANAHRFEAATALNRIEAIYQDVLAISENA
jgi:glycosyltransferase involved in cell wall biosynthesis